MALDCPAAPVGEGFGEDVPLLVAGPAAWCLHSSNTAATCKLATWSKSFAAATGRWAGGLEKGRALGPKQGWSRGGCAAALCGHVTLP